jgi:hypothetical protein
MADLEGYEREGERAMEIILSSLVLAAIYWSRKFILKYDHEIPCEE